MQLIQRSEPTATTVALGSGFCPYVMLDRTCRIVAGHGWVTHLWLYAESPGYCRPQIRQRLPDNKFWAVYDQPESTPHHGGGWQSFQLSVPFYPGIGVYYPAAYFSSFGNSPETHVILGRAWAYGDAGRIAPFTSDGVEDTSRAPCMGVTYESEMPDYLQDFDWPSNPDGWGAWTSGGVSIANSVFSSVSPYPDDVNHVNGCGTLSLLAWRNGFGDVAPNGTWLGTDLTGAQITMRARWVNWVSQQSRLTMLIQARHPSDPAKHAPYVCDAIDFNQYADGGWHEIDFTLPAAAEWAFAGGTGIYVPLDPAIVLQNVHNIHLPAIRPNGTPAPTGRFDLDWFRIV